MRFMLGDSKHHGISGYMAPIVDQELVRTRGVLLPKYTPYMDGMG